MTAKKKKSESKDKNEKDEFLEHDIEDFSEDLQNRIGELEELNESLLDEAKRNEGEKKYMKSEMVRLQKEIQRLRFELDRMKTPPMIIGTIKDVLTDGRVVVKSSTGPDFIVSTAEYISQENIIIGARVALNKQSLAVVGVLPPSLDPAEAAVVLHERRMRPVVDAEWDRARSLGISAVPTFLAGGSRLVGAQPYPALAGLVQKAGAAPRS